MARKPTVPPTNTEPKITLLDLLRSLTVPQAWAIGVAVLGLVMGSFAFGVLIESGRGRIVANSKDAEIAALTSTLSTTRLEKDQTIANLHTKNGELNRVVEALKGTLSSTLTGKELFEGKAEFLNRYVAYVQTKNDVSKKLLVDVVCSMWKETQKRRIQVQRSPIVIPVDNILRGLDSDTEQLLLRNGVAQEVLSRIQRPDTRSTAVGPFSSISKSADVQRNTTVQRDAIAALQKSTQSISIIKVITFFDGSQYQMPQEIAVAVHMKSECAPT